MRIFLTLFLIQRIGVGEAEGMDTETKQALQKLYKNLEENQEPLPHDFQQVLNDNLWSLITDSETHILNHINPLPASKENNSILQKDEQRWVYG